MTKISLKKILDEATDQVAEEKVEEILSDESWSNYPAAYLKAYEVLLEAGTRNTRSWVASRLMIYGLHDQAIELYEKNFTKSRGLVLTIAHELWCLSPSATVESIMGEYIAEYESEGEHAKIVDLVEALQVSGYKRIVEKRKRKKRPVAEVLKEASEKITQKYLPGQKPMGVT
jgi:hypothetical protein